jgi:hypothetical protein
VFCLWALALVGCGAPSFDPNEVLAEEQQDLVDPPGHDPSPGVITTDNGILMNGATLQNLATHGLAIVATSQQFLDDVANGDAARIIKYLAQCALTPEQTVEVVDGEGKRHVFHGSMGLWPAWKDGPCDETCQRWISACMDARNYFRRTLISLRIPRHSNPTAARGLVSIAGRERQAFTVQEGAFYGNYWIRPDPDVVFVHESHFCLGREPYPVGPLVPRPCDYFPDSGLLCPTLSGACGPAACNETASSAVCKVGDPNGAVGDCETSPGASTMFREVVTVFRSPTQCPHADFETGASLPWHCSSCSFITQTKLPHCAKKEWSRDCVEAALRDCADHDVCQTGAPLQMGSNDCVDQVAAAGLGWPCNFFEWDSQCVEAARQICGAPCPPAPPPPPAEGAL